MEYERIHKVQTGMISPSKLRMKLIGAHNQKKKDGSNCNSSRTSPARMEDSEFVKNSLLDSTNGDGDLGLEATSSSEVHPIQSDSAITDAVQSDGTLPPSKELQQRENWDNGRRVQLVSKGEGSNSSSVHPVRTYEDENLDYDSTSSFEFHKGETSVHHSGTRCFSRPLSSKWNDAEKWIMNRQNMRPNISKKNNLQNHMNRSSVANLIRVAPEFTGSENKPSVKRVDFCQPPTHIGFSKFAPNSGQENGESSLIDLHSESRGLQEIDNAGLPCTRNMTDENSGVPAIRSVCMRDTGTEMTPEMTPIPSQEPSRTATPVSATSPLRSPISSMPSTPRRGWQAPTGHPGDSLSHLPESGKKELSDQEQKLKTRREIVALGVQLGKTNIAAWASKYEKEKGFSADSCLDENEERMEYLKCAAAWEEVESTKHAARFKREELRIQTWESRQKAKLEAEMRKMEAQIEQTKAYAQAKMIKKVAFARQKADRKRAAAAARKNRQAEKTAAQAEHIRQTGQIPSSFLCCGWTKFKADSSLPW